MKALFMSALLISGILRGVWAIEPVFAQNMLPVVNGFIKGDKNAFSQFGSNEEGFMAPYAIHTTKFSQHRLSEAPERSVGVLPVAGPIMKYDYCGAAGTVTLRNWLKELENNPNTVATIIMIDTPGGDAYGTATLAELIKNHKKPTIAFIDDGMAASAGYWIASQANEIFASQKTDMAGSIGVLTTLVDATGFYEQQGAKVKTIYSNLSTEKNNEYHEVFENDNDNPIKNNLLDPLAKEFIGSVKEGRKGRLNEQAGDPFKGKIYMAPDALKIGLIDKIGTLEQAVRRAVKLAKNEPTVKIKLT